MRRLFILIMLFVATQMAGANPIDSVRARVVARDFLTKIGAERLGFMTDGLVNASDASVFHNIYVFQGASGQGFVLVAADDRSYPILGYSITDPFSLQGMPEHIMEWLMNYENQIDMMLTIEPDTVGDFSVMEFPDEGGEDLILPSSVRPLIATKWDQGAYYNAMCPNYSIYSKCATGCVATATAQVMKYWNWPQHGIGNHSYNSPYGMLSADFENTTYDWQNMPISLNGSSMIPHIDAVATLIYHVGVALETNYGYSSTAYTNPNGAGLPSAQSVLIDHFGYSSVLGTILRSNYSDEAWCNVLRAELDQLRPIIYSGHGSGGGHSFIVDGYDENGLFHVNWGWSGRCDGYYMMGVLNPGLGGIGAGTIGAYNSNNKAIIGIMPENMMNSMTNITAVANNPDWGSVLGGGMYFPYSDNVTLTAVAEDDCRFVGWTDGVKVNPRSFMVTSIDQNFMAIFEKVEGDTLCYCMNDYALGMDFRHWGIRIPSSMISLGMELREVQAFLPSQGSYKIEIYNGYYPFPHLIYSQDIENFTPGTWNTFVLDAPVMLVGVENIWITIASPDAERPAACSAWGGNTEGQYCSNDGVRWYELGRAGSCMVRGIFYTPDDEEVEEPVVNPSVPGIGGVLVEIGSENSRQTDDVMPVCTNHKYSLVEVILKENELNGANEFGGISFYYNSNTPLTAKTNCKIYIQPVSVGQFWSEYNMENIYSSAVLVYEGSLNCESGWNRFDFTVPYTYNGQGDLMLIIADNSGKKQNNAQFKVESCSLYLTLSYHRESSADILNNAYWPSNAVKTRYAKRPVMKLWGVGSAEDSVDAITPINPGVSDDSSLFVVHDTVYLIDTIVCDTYTLSVACNDSSMGVCAGSGVFHKGSSVEIMAINFSGRRFVGWDDGSVENPRRLTVDSNMVVTAVFEPLIPDGGIGDEDDEEEVDEEIDDDDDGGDDDGDDEIDDDEVDDEIDGV